MTKPIEAPCLATVRGLLSALAVVVVLVSFVVLPAEAAEVLQVRSATLLQVGDQNRSYGVELACIALPEAQQAEATSWLRRELPRRTRVNLRPQGTDQGVLLARVARLDRGSDLSSDLVAAGFGQLQTGCAA